jgi:catechol 2,3-dioxygenase-like lactoylglutathione lyase family enzyme
MGIEKLDHYAVRTTDLARSIRFYEEALGLRAGARPPFPFPGAWMYALPQPDAPEGKPIVHLIVAEPGGEAGGSGTNAFDHIALAATGFADMCARLGRHGVAFRERKIPDRDLRQVFVRDPDGVMIELNYSHPDDLAQ